MANVGTAYVTIAPTMKGFSSSVSSALNGQAGNLGASASSSFSSKFQSTGTSKIGAVMGAVAGVAGTVATTAFNAIGSSMGAAISRVDQLNNFPKVMQNLGYSSDDASRSIQKMSNAIDGLPTSLDTLSGMTQQLAPLCSNLDEATDISIALNNAMLAGGKSSEDVSRAMTQYTQALSKGKPDLMDWRTLQEVMPGQLNQIAQAMLGAGKNSNDLYTELKNGTVTMTDFNNAVLQLNSEGIDGFASFEQQARDATQGIGTALSNVKNRLAKAGETLINAFGATRISGAINGVTSSFGKIANTIAPVFSVLGNVSEWTVKAIGSLASTITGKLSPAFDAIKGKVQPVADAFNASFGTIKERLENIATACGVSFQGFFSQVKNGSLNLQSVTSTFDVIKQSLQNVFDDTPVKQYVDTAKSKFAELSGAVTGGNFTQVLLGDNFENLPASVQAVCNGINSNFQQLAELASNIKAKFDEAFGGIAERFAGFASSIDFNVVASVFDTAISGIVGKFTPIVTFVNSTLSEVFNFLVQVGQGIGDAFSNFDISGLQVLFNLGTLVTPLGLLSTALSQIGGVLSETIGSVLQTLAPLITLIVSSALGLIQSLLPMLINVNSIISSVIATGLNMVMTVLQALTPVFTILVNLISQIVPILTELAGSILQSLMTVFSMIATTIAQLASEILPIILQVIQMITPFIQQLATIILQLVQSLAPVISQLISSLLPVIQQILGALQPLVEAVLNVVQSVLPIVQAGLEVVMSVIEALVPIIANIASVVTSVISAILPVISTVISVVSQIMTVVVNVIATILTTISPVVSFIAGIITSIISCIGNVIKVITGILSTVISVISGIISGVANFVSTVINTISGFISKITGFFTSLGSKVVSTVSGMWNNVVNGFSSGVTSAVNFVKNLPQKVLEIFSNAGTWLVESGKSMITGLVDGIKNAISGAVNTVSDAIGKIRDLFPFSPAKKGPFSGRGWVLYSGISIMNALADGVEKRAGATVRTVKGVMQDVADATSLNATSSLAFAGGSLNGSTLQVDGLNSLQSSRDQRTINIALNYSASDNARTMFNDLVTRLETLDKVKG